MSESSRVPDRIVEIKLFNCMPFIVHVWIEPADAAVGFTSSFLSEYEIIHPATEQPVSRILRRVIDERYTEEELRAIIWKAVEDQREVA